MFILSPERERMVLTAFLVFWYVLSLSVCIRQKFVAYMTDVAYMTEFLKV